MADDKTAALVVALSAQLTRFERDMKSAGDIADREASRIEKRFSDLNPLAGTFLGNFAANLSTKAFDSAIDFVKDLTRRFVELDATAKLVGESMRDVFGIQQAAAKAKVPVDDVTASVKGLATLLDQLQRGEKNSLSELFAANPDTLKGVDLQALNLQQTFAIIADLVRNARTEIQKIDLAQAAGQTASMVKFLQQGGEAVTYLSKNAAATAPDLQKLADTAKAFDEAWRLAVQNVKSYLSEHLFDIFKQDLADIIALLGIATKFLNLFKNGPIDASTSKAAEDLDKLRSSLLAFKNARDTIDESAGLDTSKNARADRRVAQPPEPRQTGTSTRDPSAPLSNVPLKTQETETRDAFDRTEEQITKHTASVNADTIAVAQNTAVQAQLRAEFQLLNAIRKDEGEVTQAQIDQYTKLRETMSAQQALDAAGIDLSTKHKVAFMAASEGAAAATSAYTKAADGVAKLNSASQQLGSALSTAFADAVVEGKSLNEVFTNLLKTLEKAAINSVFSSFFNQQAGGGLSPFASLLKGTVPGFAEGTDFAPGGLAWVGERGKELVNLPRGSQVIPNGRATGGSTFAPVYQINAAGADSGTVARIQSVLERHAKAIAGQAKGLQSAQRMQATGVG
jgi:hypothetical protein